MTTNLIYTDGACSKNGKKGATGGYGIYLKESCFGSEIKINCKGEPMHITLHDLTTTFPVTNIRMEGLAIIATMFLYAEQFVFGQDIIDPVIHLNQKFLKQDRPLKLFYQSGELVQTSAIPGAFEIVTDSKFWMDVLYDPRYMSAWVSKGLLTKRKNPDLLLLLYYYSTLLSQNGVQMQLTHVRSHQVGKRTFHADGNDVADILATSAAGNDSCAFMQV